MPGKSRRDVANVNANASAGTNNVEYIFVGIVVVVACEAFSA